MRYAGLIKEDFDNGPGIGVSLFIQGCPHKCEGCFNPETWDFNGGEELTDEIHNQILEAVKKPYITRFSLLGGEPFGDKTNFSRILNLLVDIKTVRPDIQIWCWTGFTLKEVKLIFNQVLSLIDYLVDGAFIQEQKDITLKYRGSYNQRVWDLTHYPIITDITEVVDPCNY